MGDKIKYWIYFVKKSGIISLIGKLVLTSDLLVSFSGSNITEMIFFKAEDPVKSEVVVSIPYIVSIIRKELKSHLKSK